MYRPTLQRIPLSEVFHITGFLPASEVETVMVCDCCRFNYYTPSCKFYSY